MVFGTRRCAASVTRALPRLAVSAARIQPHEASYDVGNEIDLIGRIVAVAGKAQCVASN